MHACSVGVAIPDPARLRVDDPLESRENDGRRAKGRQA
jgi:hypothetical protein